MSVAFVPIYLAFLGPEAYGVIGMVALIQAFMLILDFGMTPTLTREAARFEAGEVKPIAFKDLLRSVEWVVLGLGTLIVAVIAAAAAALAVRWLRLDALDQTTVAQSLTIAGALIALRFFESVYRGTLYGLQRQLVCNAIAALFATIRGGGAVAVLAWVAADLRGFFVWQAAISVLSVVAMRSAVYLALPRTPRGGRFSAAALASIGRFAGGMVLISILSLAATQADKVLLSRLVTLEAFGYYMFAVNVVLAIELVFAPIMTAVYPRLVSMIGAGDVTGLRTTFHDLAAIVAALTASIAALLAVQGSRLLLVWSQDAQIAASAGPLLTVLGLGSFLHAQCVLGYYLQLAHGWTRLGVLTNLGALVLTVSSMLTIVPQFGTMAAAWTWVAVSAVYFFLSLPVMFMRLLPAEQWRFYVLDVGVPALAAASGVLLTALAWAPRVTGGLTDVFHLAVTFGAALIASAGCLTIVRPGIVGRVAGRHLVGEPRYDPLSVDKPG